MGWLLVKKHPHVHEAGKKIDISDLNSDPVLRFQKKHYGILMPLLCFILPTIIPVVFWQESWIYGWLVPACFRYVLTLHITWSLNSFAHMFGNKPYDKQITPTQNVFVAGLALGEGWHNYHHVRPATSRSSLTKFLIHNRHFHGTTKHLSWARTDTICRPHSSISSI
jgi:stearoyl-CoA desaturase (delta-9 desaturase)